MRWVASRELKGEVVERKEGREEGEGGRVTKDALKSVEESSLSETLDRGD